LGTGVPLLGEVLMMRANIVWMATPNTLFAIIDVSEPAALKTRMLDIGSWPSLELQEGQWLLVAPNATTTQEVAEKVGLGGIGTAKGLILRVENYYGRNYQTVWEWITTKQGAILGA
jgi:hypothetical protein